MKLKFNVEAIKAAKLELDIIEPTIIRFATVLLPSRVGEYHYDSKQRKHIIELLARRSVEDTSASLWHELAHAMQYERNPEEFDKQYNKSTGSNALLGSAKIGYLNNDYEVEARRIAIEHAHDLLITGAE